MYHSVYPASWLIGNNQKSPILMTYSNDIPIIAVDSLSALSQYGHFSSLYTSPIIVDLPNMKHVPVGVLMRNVESLNCLVPVWQRQDFNWTVSDCQFSKDSLLDISGFSDSAATSSRSSTPSSVGAASISGSKASREDVAITPFKRQRKSSNGGNSGHRNSNRYRNSPFRQQQSPSIASPLCTTALSKHSAQLTAIANQWDSPFSRDIWNFYIKNRQPEDMYFKKMRLRNNVHFVLSHAFPNCGLSVVGSSVNGLGANTSDMDMCLILTATEIDQQTEAMIYLKCVQEMLCRCHFIKATDLITAKVPILKFTDEANILVDLNINNTVGIANSHLIRNYCCLDWRVQPLVLVIKKWAQDCNINNAKDMTLSSYSLTLMVLHYLQCGCTPFVLPSLQKMRPKKYLPENLGNWQDSPESLPNFKSRNTQALGDLLTGFFDYFSNLFNFDRDVMSIRLGSKFPKHIAMNYRSSKNKRGHWKYICIEEPFNRTNTACAVYDADSFARILTSFRSTWVKLKSGQDASTVLKL